MLLHETTTSPDIQMQGFDKQIEQYILFVGTFIIKSLSVWQTPTPLIMIALKLTTYPFQLQSN